MNEHRDPLDALGDPTRRAIVDHLRRGPSPVGVIAEGVPVSRPAVSQHLAVLRQAGLVTERADGTRRIYRLDPKGFEALRTWLAAVTDDAAAAQAGEAKSTSGSARKAFAASPAAVEAPPPAEGGHRGDGKKKRGKKRGKR